MEVNESRIYVGNLPFSIGFQELKELFSQFGEVVEATVVVNRYSGRSKGFGFVTFSSADSAQKAISEMNEKDVQGRRITVKPAMPPREREEGEEREFRDDRPRRDRY
ncbi:RNA-binding protein [Candidatus Pacearchaeota archaeon]|nr:RNA-binding protein [Candidatus Pacearchaeota archaeon]